MWGLSQHMRKAWGRLKMLSKNTCDGVYLIVKLLAISLKACKFTKKELLHTEFQLDFKLLFIVLFLGIISLKNTSGFNGVGFAFQMGGFIFKWGCPVGGIGLDVVFSVKFAGWDPHAPCPTPAYYGKLWESCIGTLKLSFSQEFSSTLRTMNF